MADQQRRVSLIFDADSSKVQSKIDNLSNSLQKVLNLSSRNSGISSLNEDLRNAGNAAAQLQVQLSNAFNVNTGKLDLSKFHESLNRGRMGIQDYHAALTSIGSSGQTAFMNLARSISNAEIPLKRSNELLDRFATSLKNTVQWQLSSSLMHGFIGAIQSAMSYAEHLNKNLTDIRIVTGQSAEEMARFAEQANKSARELSTTTNQYAQAALIFYQQGLSDKVVKERTDAVIKMANVTGEAAKDVSSYMTAIWNNFDDGSKSIEYYADVITKLGAATAASSEEIAGGLEKFAAVGKTIGLSYEYATAMLTTIIDKTRQSEDVVGTALKTILARIQGLNLGETLDDGTTLNKYSSALASVGVQIKDTSGELRSMDAILDDLGAKWQTLSKDTQVALAQVVGGVRQYNQILSLMNNWEAFEMNVDIASGAEGSLDEQAKIYAESWEASQKRVQAALEAIWSSLIDENFFIGVNKVLAEVLGLVDNFIDGIGGIQGVLTTLGTIAVKVFGNQISKGLKDLTYNISSLTKTGTQQLENFQKKTRDLLKETAVNKGTTGSGMMADAFKREAEAQMALAKASKSMSEEERAIASILQQQLQARIDNQIEASRAVDSTEQELNNIKQITDKLISKNEINLTIPEGVTTKWAQLKKDITEVTTFNPATSNLFNDFTAALNDTSLNTEEKIERMKNSIQDFETAVGSIEDKNIKTIFESLKKSVEDTNFDNIKNDLNKFIGSLSGDARTRIEEFIMASEEMAQKMRKTGDIAKAVQYDKMASELKELIQKTDDYSKALDRGAQASKDAVLAQQNLQDYLEKTGIKVLSTQDKIVKFADILGTMATVVTTISGVWETLNDESKSTGEKIMAVVSAIALLIPMIVSASTSIKEIGVSTIASKMALERYSIEAIKGATANMTFGASLHAALGPIGLVTLAIAGLVAAIAAISNAVNNDPLGNLNKEIAKAEAKGRELRSELQEIGNEINTIYDDFNQYDIALTALNELTVGTEDWYEQLSKVSGLTDDLLTNYPILADMQAHPGKYAGVTLKDAYGNFTPEALTLAKDYSVQQKMAEAAQATTGVVNSTMEKVHLQDELTALTLQEKFGNGFSWIGEGAKVPYSDRVLELLTPVFTAMVSSGKITSDSTDYDLFNPKTILSQIQEMPQYYDNGEWTESGRNLIWGIQSSTGAGMKSNEQVYGMAHYDFLSREYSARADKDTDYYNAAFLSWLQKGNAQVANTNPQLNLQNTSDLGNELIQYLFGDVASAARQTHEEIYNDDFNTTFDQLATYGLQRSGLSEQDITTPLVHAYGITGKDEAQPITNIGEIITTSPGQIAEMLGYSSKSNMQFDYDSDNDVLSYQDPYGEEGAEPIKIENASSALGYLQWFTDNAKDIKSAADVIGIIHSDVKEVADLDLLKSFYSGISLDNFSQKDLGRLTDLGISVDSKYLDTNFWGNEALQGKDFTYAQANQYLGLSSAKRGMLEPYLQDHPELLNSVEGEGYTWIKNLNKQLEGLGYNITERSDEMKNFEREITQGYLAIGEFSGLNGQNINYAQALINGENLGVEELKALQDSGLDIWKLQSSAEGKDYFNQVMSDYMTAIQQLGMVKSNFGSRDQRDWDAIAQAYGFENITDTAIDEKFGSDQGFRDAIQETLDNTDFDALAASIAQMGLDAADTINSLGPEYYDKYLETMIKAQAQIDGIELDDSFWDAEDLLKAYKNLRLGTRLGTGISQLVNNFTDSILDGTAKDLATIAAKGGILTPEEREKLENMRSMVGNLLGLDSSLITDEFLSQDDTQKYLQGIVNADSVEEVAEQYQAFLEYAGGDKGKLTLPENFKTEDGAWNTEEITKFAEAYIRSAAQEIDLALSLGVQQGLEAFKNDDFSNISQSILHRGATELKNKNYTVEEKKAFAQQMGYIDAEGKTTAQGEMAGYGQTGVVLGETYLNQILTDVISGMYDAASRYNPADLIALGNSMSESILTEIFEGFNDQNGLSTLTYKQAQSIVDIFDEAPNLESTELLKDYFMGLYDATGDIDKTIALFSNIDWETITVEDLAHQMELMGYTAELDDKALQSLIISMQQAITYTDGLTTALNNYSSLSSMADAIRNGDSISAEQKAQYAAVAGEDHANAAFEMNPDGSYRLADGWDPNLFAGSVEQGLLADFRYAEREANEQAGFVNGLETESDFTEAAFDPESDYAKEVDRYLGTLYNNLPYGASEDAQKAINAFRDTRDETTYNAMLKSTGFENFEDMNAHVGKITNLRAEEASEVSEGYQEELKQKRYDMGVEESGRSAEEIDKMGDSLQKMAEASKDAELGAEGLSEALIEDADAADEVAKEIARYDAAVISVAENYDSWVSAMDSGVLEDQVAAMEEMDKAYSNMLDIDPGTLSDGFLANAENLELMKEAANGSAEAYEELMNKAGEDIIMQCGLDASQFYADKAAMEQSLYDLTGKEWDDIEVGAKLNDQEFLDALTRMVNAADMTATQATNYLASMGIDAEVVTDTTTEEETNESMGWTAELVPVSAKNRVIEVSSDGLGNVTAEEVDAPDTVVHYATYTPDPVEETSTKEQKAFALKVTSASKSSGGNFKHSNSSAGSGSSRPRPRGSGSSRRGGGGGRRRAAERPREEQAAEPVRAAKKREKEKERYHSLLNVLEDLTRAYEKIEKAADRAFGKARIKLLGEQEKELKKLAAVQKDYIDEINKYYEQDKANLEQVAAFAGVGIELNGYGTITNFDEIQDAMWNAYNSHINANDEVIGMDDEAWGKYEEEWGDMMDLIDQYEETQDLREEALMQLQEYINQLYDLQLEKVTYAVEIDIESAEFSLAFLDHLLSRIEDDAWSAAEAISMLGDEAANILEQNDTMQSGIRDILMNHTKDITDANGEVLKAADLTEAEVEAFLNGDQAVMEKIKDLGLEGGFTADEVETLKEYHEKLMEISESLIELREQVYATVLNAFEQFNEEMDDTISKMQHLLNITHAYRDIVDIVGKQNLKVSNTLLEAMGQSGIEQSLNILGSARLKKETIQSEIAAAEESLRLAKEQGLEEDVKLWEQNLKVMYESLYEAEEEFMSSWAETMEYINEQFQLMVENIAETFSDMMAGPLSKSLDLLQDAFNRHRNLDNLHLEDFEKIYEFSKLTRDITNSIDNTENVQAKRELAELQREINELEESGVEISQYQMENLRRRYELKVAELALLEAQNAKSQVQMQRDSDGNWNYVYTADSDTVSTAEQNYEDRLYALQVANGEYINTMQEMLIQTQMEMKAKIEEITADETLSMEEKHALIHEYTQYYMQKFNEYSAELGLVLDNNALLYEQDWTRYSELTGYKISADEEYVDKFNETVLSVVTGLGTMEEFNTNFQIATEAMLESLSDAFNSWSENVDSAMDAAGTSVDNFADDMSDMVTDVTKDSEDLELDFKDLASNISTTFSNITTATSNWASAHSSSIDAAIRKNDQLIASYGELLDAWSDYQTAISTPTDNETDTSLDTKETIGGDKTGTGFGTTTDIDGGGGGGDDEPEPDGHEKIAGTITVSEGYQYWGYSDPKGGEANRIKVVNDDRAERTYEFTEMDTSTQFNRVWIPSEGVWMSTVDPGTEGRLTVKKYDTGGYTGAWNDKAGRWALLHEKELVLNKEDTSNMLKTIDFVRQIAQQIDINALSSAGFFTKDLIHHRFSGNGQTFEQEVHITAEFPNATDKNEIYAAFGELINLASQYANRR